MELILRMISGERHCGGCVDYSVRLYSKRVSIDQLQYFCQTCTAIFASQHKIITCDSSFISL